MRWINSDCNLFDGDTDVNKCAIHGYISTCAGCEYYLKEHNLKECPYCGEYLSKSATECLNCFSKIGKEGRT